MLCPECSAENEENAKHCAMCGIDLRKARREAAENSPAEMEAALAEPSDTESEFAFSPRPVGTYPTIGGWLVLVAVLLVVGTGLFIFGLGMSLKEMSGPGLAFVEEGVKKLVYFNLGTAIFSTLFIIYLDVIFFTRKKSLPKMIIIFQIYMLAKQIINYAWFVSLGLDKVAEAAGMESQVIGMRVAIFLIAMFTFFIVPYFLMSERVKGTFVN